jgi:hypothetical protein
MRESHKRSSSIKKRRKKKKNLHLPLLKIA